MQACMFATGSQSVFDTQSMNKAKGRQNASKDIIRKPQMECMCADF